MVRKAKLAILQAANQLGLYGLTSGSAWRKQRLLILCYHGTSLEDEHEWNDGLYVSPEHLRRRMKAVKEARCNVLGLDEAVRRLYAGTLPERATVITFDDGSYDFYKLGFPIVREYGFPVTLYYTTYYSEYNRPVFDVMCSYLLWKGRQQNQLKWPEALPSPVSLADKDQRLAAVRRLKEFAREQKFSGRQKDALLADLAGRLNIDYEELCRKRLLHLITPQEGRELVAQGLDVQFHTHRHRVYRRQERFHQELDDNLQRIRAVTAVPPGHFCYTGGFYLADFPEFLKNYGIRSATTCDVGLCTPQTNPMLLPRLLDTMNFSDLEFRGWLTGFAALLPRKQYPMSEGQLIEEQEAPVPEHR